MGNQHLQSVYESPTECQVLNRAQQQHCTYVEGLQITLAGQDKDTVMGQRFIMSSGSGLAREAANVGLVEGLKLE